jgi:hypothetical protein
MINPRFSMKKIHFFQVLLPVSLAVGLFAFSSDASGADAKPDAASTETNLVPSEPPVPQSVFDLSQPYKDPFFPNSTRKRVEATVTNIVNTSDPTQYVLKGLSGVEGQEVAIINNRNLAAGERGEITLASGVTVWIKVQKIDGHSATILPDGQREPITISLPKEDW